MKYCLFLLTLYLFVYQTRGQCSNFPKLLGGTYGESYLYDIDANLEKNIIVAVGKTSDYTILGTTSSVIMPYIAVFKFSSASILWGNADNDKTGSYFQKVTLSPNGLYIAAQLYYSLSPTNGFVMIFRSDDGALVSSTKY